MLSSNPETTNSRIYAARPVLASGSCKRETAEAHTKLLQMVIDACREQQERIGAQLFCLASDGEARRGRSFVTLTHKHSLPSSSSIYAQLSPLSLFNKLVGDHDLTSDKDYKHIIKRIRSWLIRAAGVRIGDVEITSAMLAAHLAHNDMPKSRIDAYMRPDDRQDVTLAANLVKAVWSLPLAVNPGAPPGFAEQQKAIYLLGCLIYYTVSPYIDLSMSLSEQLESLSAASHLALYLFAKDNARSYFINSQLYIDIQIMIKNVYFCVAKQKVLDNNGVFYIIQLGTDRVEVSFGILRTMVGNDCHTDMLQLADRLSNITVCSNILAEHPEWDRTPRQLHLPSLNSDGELLQRTDHINPANWRGDVAIKNVILLTKWKTGRRRIEELISDAASLFRQMESDRCNVFNPFRSPSSASLYDLVNEPHDWDEEEGIDGSGSVVVDSSPLLLDSLTEEDSTSGLTLADLAGIEANKDKVESMILVCTSSNPSSPAHPVYKARLLAASEHDNSLMRTSADRIKRYANIARHSTATIPSISNVVDGDADNSTSMLTSGDPAITIVKQQQLLFLAVIQVNGIHINSRSVSSLSLDVLDEAKIAVSFQIMHLTEMTPADRGLMAEDWRTTGAYEIGTYRTEGRFIQCVNPAIFTRDSSMPSWALSTALLQELGAMLFSKLSKNDRRCLPNVHTSDTFPYRGSEGGFCKLILSLNACPLYPLRSRSFLYLRR